MGSHQELADKVKAILEGNFSPADIILSVRDSVIVFLFSEQFEGMDVNDRQDAIWTLLETTLDRDELRAVSIVVALTPKEREFHTAGSL